MDFSLIIGGGKLIKSALLKTPKKSFDIEEFYNDDAGDEFSEITSYYYFADSLATTIRGLNSVSSITISLQTKVYPLDMLLKKRLVIAPYFTLGISYKHLGNIRWQKDEADRGFSESANYLNYFVGGGLTMRLKSHEYLDSFFIDWNKTTTASWSNKRPIAITNPTPFNTSLMLGVKFKI